MSCISAELSIRSARAANMSRVPNSATRIVACLPSFKTILQRLRATSATPSTLNPTLLASTGHTITTPNLTWVIVPPGHHHFGGQKTDDTHTAFTNILTSPLSQLSLHPSFPLPGAVGLSAETPATSTTGTDTNNGVEDVTSIISLVKSKPQGTVKCMAQEVPGFLVADFMLLFPGVSIQGEGLNVILLSQHTVDDMTVCG